MYERAIDIIDLATRMQAARGGVTIAQIRERLGISRRTAERLRDAVDERPLMAWSGNRARLWWTVSPHFGDQPSAGICGPRSLTVFPAPISDWSVVPS